MGEKTTISSAEGIWNDPYIFRKLEPDQPDQWSWSCQWYKIEVEVVLLRADNFSVTSS